MQKKVDVYCKPITELYKDKDSAIRIPQYKCIWRWGDDQKIFEAIGNSKKLAEHSCAQKMLKYKFPNNWSYGYMLEYIKVNWERKRKREDG